MSEQRISQCATHSEKLIGRLSQQELAESLTLPCGCKTLTLKQLVRSYHCAPCDKIYWYSFCLERIVEEEETWHCEFCAACY